MVWWYLESGFPSFTETQAIYQYTSRGRVEKKKLKDNLVPAIGKIILFSTKKRERRKFHIFPPFSTFFAFSSTNKMKITPLTYRLSAFSALMMKKRENS